MRLRVRGTTFGRLVVLLAASMGVCLSVSAGCQAEQPAGHVSAEVAVTLPVPVANAVVRANNYSDRDFQNGIFVRDGRTNVFYFLMERDRDIPIRSGDELIFAESGAAVVDHVDSQVQADALAVFVTVNRDLNPVGDGFPHPIVLVARH